MNLTDWLIKGSSELGFQIDVGFELKLKNGSVVASVARVCNFGAENGMLIVRSFDEVCDLGDELTQAGYGYSVMSSGGGYEDNLESLEEVLNDWGWTGDLEHKPAWAMTPAPEKIDGAKVVSYAHIGADHVPTGKVRHTIEGKMVGPAKALAICQYDDSKEYYLFGCDVNWQAVTDTCHETIEAAKQQADLEYSDIDGAWIDG